MGTESDQEAVAATALHIRGNSREPLSVGAMAARVGYSPTHLTRLFARISRTSPNRYLGAIRIEDAKEMFLGSGLSVLEVCHAVGYDSLGTFTRRFTDIVGVPPGRFRALAEGQGRDLPVTRSPIEPRGGGISGTVGFETDPPPSVYSWQVWVGLFPRPVPVGVPLAGTLLRGAGSFTIPLPMQRCWLLAAAVPSGGGRAGFLPRVPWVADAGSPVESGHVVALTLRPWRPFQHPVSVVLPPLASDGAPSGGPAESRPPCSRHEA